MVGVFVLSGIHFAIFGESPVCKSAIHAGVLGPQGGSVYVRRHNIYSQFQFVGTVRNRVVSNSKTDNVETYYSFTGMEQWIPEGISQDTWMSDVILVHNSYNGNGKSGFKLWVTCLYEKGQNNKQFWRWNFFEIPVLRKTGARIEHFTTFDDNKRILQCYGDNPFTDVKAVISKPTDEFLTVSISNRGVQGRSLRIQFEKFKANVNVGQRRLPDNWQNFAGNSIAINQMSDIYSGDHIVGEVYQVGNGNWQTWNAEANGAYFQIFIQDCSIGYYGRNCHLQCHCQNEGVCHPLIGACICRPGFYGKKCEKRCKLDHFGSECQFTCNPQTLGEAIVSEKQNCLALLFCLPEPFGCSCAVGYKGRFCNQYEELQLPYFVHKSDLLLNEKEEVVVKFHQWDPESDRGDNYGFEISEYEVHLISATDKSSISVKRVMAVDPLEATFHDVRAEGEYEVRVLVRLLDFTKLTGRSYSQQSMSDMASTTFTLPCLGPDVLPLMLNQTQNYINALIKVPKTKEGDLKCFVVVRHESGLSKSCFGISVSPTQDYVSCQVGDLKSGQKYKVEYWCENKIGKCRRREFTTVTLVSLEDWISYGDFMITLSKFDLLEDSPSHRLLVVKVNDIEKWNIYKKDIVQYGRFNNSAQPYLPESTETLASELKNWEKAKEGDVYVLSLDPHRDSEPFLVGVIFTYFLNNSALNQYANRKLISVTDFLSTSTINRRNPMAAVIYSLASIGFLVALVAILIKLKGRHARKATSARFSNFMSEGVRFRKRRQVNQFDDHKILKTSEPQTAEGLSNKEQVAYVNLVSPLSATSLPVKLRTAPQIPKPETLKLPAAQISNSHDTLMPVTSKTNEKASSPVYVNADTKGLIPLESLYMNVEESNAQCYLATFEAEKLLNGLINSPIAFKEFLSVPTNYGKSMLAAKEPANVMKNRYKNNLPYDDTRVVLSTINDDPYSDYINANFVKCVNPYKWYIACQGPKDANKNTTGDFWRMILEMGIEMIVMIANFVENDKVKVGQYFSREQTMEVYGMTVSVIEYMQHSHFVRSHIQICYDSEIKNVVHYQFTKWPDHGIPSQVYPVCSMLTAITEEFPQGGMVVHCSAGIGRTGCILIVFLLKEMFELNSSIDPVFILRNMRECRARLVENIHQYNFSLQVLHYLLFSDKGLISSVDLVENYDNYLSDSTKLYQELLAQPIQLSYDVAQDPRNLPFNRNFSVLPADFYLVADPSSSNFQYINAIFVDLEDIKKSIIVTEHPMISTLYRFWQMVVRKSCSSLILINNIPSSKEYPTLHTLGEDIAFPDDFSIDIQPVSNELYENVSCYGATVTCNGISHYLEIYQLETWPSHLECPSDVAMLATTSDIILKKAKTNTPAVLCCSDGVTGCGIVAAAANVISHLQLYQAVNVYYTAVRLRRYRPQFITSQRQFAALYQVASSHIQSNDTYQNFS